MSVQIHVKIDAACFGLFCPASFEKFGEARWRLASLLPHQRERAGRLAKRHLRLVKRLPALHSAIENKVVTVAPSNILEDVYRGLVQGNLSQVSEAVVHATRAIEQIFATNPLDASNGPSTNVLSTLPTSLADFFASRTAFENSSIVLLVSAFLALLMSSWTQRFGNLGRFSPFAREPPKGSHTVSDDDFSYITAEDLRRHESETLNQPARDTDVLRFRNKKVEHAVHFPAYSISKGELMVTQVRDQAARKIGVADPRRVKLLFHGKKLEDGLTCKQYGLVDGSEIWIVAGDTSRSPSESDGEDTEDLEDGAVDGEPARRKRNRGKKTKRRNRREPGAPPSESNLNIPSGSQQPSRPISPRPQAAPTTPLGKLDALREKLDSFIPDCNAFETSPPTDPAKREFEHKKLSETILTQVLLKTDAVETEGDTEARTRRKELVKRTQELLHRLDAVMKA